MCVCERERERKGEKERERERDSLAERAGRAGLYYGTLNRDVEGRTSAAPHMGHRWWGAHGGGDRWRALRLRP